MFGDFFYFEFWVHFWRVINLQSAAERSSIQKIFQFFWRSMNNVQFLQNSVQKFETPTVSAENVKVTVPICSAPVVGGCTSARHSIMFTGRPQCNGWRSDFCVLVVFLFVIRYVCRVLGSGLSSNHIRRFVFSDFICDFRLFSIPQQ